MRKLSPKSLAWALRHLQAYSDTDKFPLPFEIEVIQRTWKTHLLPVLQAVDLSQHRWHGERKMLVPKDEVAFRNAAQLDPLDAVLFAALIREIGPQIEKARMSVTLGRVFSYRFKPTADGRLFGDDRWDDFWNTALARTSQSKYVLVADIVDFYNQVSHHSVENQLHRCGVDQQDVKIVLNLLKSTTMSISKGIPIGPHPSHLLAEASLIPIDELLTQRGFTFCRYVDDILIFCATQEQAQVAAFVLAGALDQYHKLTLNRQKTQVMTAASFRAFAQKKAEDEPINNAEAALLRIIRSHSVGPYTKIRVSRLSETELSQLSQETIEAILRDYLKSEERDYVRLRFFLRRLTQVGVPGGVEFLVSHLPQLLPALSEIVAYLNSARTQYVGSWPALGESLLALLESPIARESEYVQIVLLGMFARISDLNHVDKLTMRFSSSSSSAQREIVLAAAASKADAWLRTLKADFSRHDPWLRRSLLHASRVLPRDERKFWHKEIKPLCNDLELAVLADAAT